MAVGNDRRINHREFRNEWKAFQRQDRFVPANAFQVLNRSADGCSKMMLGSNEYCDGEKAGNNQDEEPANLHVARTVLDFAGDIVRHDGSIAAQLGPHRIKVAYGPLIGLRRQPVEFINDACVNRIGGGRRLRRASFVAGLLAKLGDRLGFIGDFLRSLNQKTVVIERKALRESLDLQLDLALQSAVFRQENRSNKRRETLDFYRIARLRQDQGDLYIARKVRLCLDPFQKDERKNRCNQRICHDAKQKKSCNSAE
ncbi:hypothetical protein [Rhizobium mongolense]|uniref:hypothetical protein n=1 Tax=Rhizobium mongolense TaxID=57676 RepID=UPI001428B075|nr:hypothetical protein [Rhizobium mongolense]